MTESEDGTTTERQESQERSVDSIALEIRIKTMLKRRNAELARLWRRAAERDAQYLRERTESIHTWMDPEAQWIERECDALYAKTLAALPEACRATFIAVREDELSYAEAATKLGISVKMVGKHISHAQREFRVALREYGIVPPPEKRAKRDRIAFQAVDDRADLSRQAPPRITPAVSRAKGAPVASSSARKKATDAVPAP